MKLFGRLLLWFLAANALTAVVAIVLGNWVVNLAYSESDAQRDGRAAVAVYEHEGSEGLGRWARQQWQQNGVVGMLHGDDGRPLARLRMLGGPSLSLNTEPGRAGMSPPPPMTGAGGEAGTQMQGEPETRAPDGNGNYIYREQRAEHMPPPAPGTAPMRLELRAAGGGRELRMLREEAYFGFSLPLRNVEVTGGSGKTYRWIASKPPPQGYAALVRDGLLRVLISLLVIGAAAWLAARRIVQPIDELERTSQALAGGDLGARVAGEVVARDDEVGGLGRAFNDMAERIDKLVDSHRRLLRDVSHELRTPLARLRIAAELARERGEARHFERIEQELEQLTALIQQVLLLARLDDPQAGGAQPLGEFALPALLQDICAGARIEAQQRHVEIVCTVEGGGMVRGSQLTLRSALENILRNAVRFTPEGSSVTASVARRDGQLHISICDHGPGVPEDSLAAIFQPFVRVSSARERQDDGNGVGLGLTIADAAVRAHGGTIRARNRDGGGLCVEVSLPASDAA